MTLKDLKRPRRVWVNSPSTLQPRHDLHGRVGIAVVEPVRHGEPQVCLYFTEGDTLSTLIDPLYLSPGDGR